jgi:hypothetical protein
VLLTALGVDVEVRVSGDQADEAVAEIERVWAMCRPPYAAPAGSAGRAPRAVVKVVHGERTPARSDVAGGKVEGSDLPDLMQMVTQAVTRAAIDAQKGRVVMFHAAGLQHPATGATVALVGPGGTGKTTLARTLGPGRGYVTDETVAVRDDGAVLPYPKPLSLRREPTSPWKDETEPSSLGLAAPRDGALAKVVLLERRDDHDGAPEVEDVHVLDAIAALTPETSHLPELERPLHRVAALCDSTGGVVRVTYREAVDLGGLVDGWLEAGA